MVVGVSYGEGPPVPIPNTEVKLTRADNTWLVTAREDRYSPTLIYVETGIANAIPVVFLCAVWYDYSEKFRILAKHKSMIYTKMVGGIKICTVNIVEES